MTNKENPTEPLPPAPGSATLAELLEDYRREKRQYEACGGAEVFAKKRGHRDGMKTIALKIADLLEASPNDDSATNPNTL